MIVESKYRERSLEGEKATTRRIVFDSQAEQAWFLRCMVDEYRGMLALRQVAKAIAFDKYGAPPKHHLAQALALADWVQKNIEYVNEGTEIFQTPPRTLRVGFGDCDDHTTLLATLLECLGIPAQIVVLWWERGYRHVYPRALVQLGGRRRWVALDTTLSTPVGQLRNPLVIAARTHPDLRMLRV